MPGPGGPAVHRAGASASHPHVLPGGDSAVTAPCPVSRGLRSPGDPYRPDTCTSQEGAADAGPQGTLWRRAEGVEGIQRD